MKFDRNKFSFCARAATRSICSSSPMAANQERIFCPSYGFQKQAHISDFKTYREQYDLSLSDPHKFWSAFAKDFHWKKPPTKEQFLKYNFDNRKGPIFVKWMDGAEMNVCYNVVDRHVRNGNGDKLAYYWEGNHPHDRCSLTYKQLQDEVCRFGNVLRANGIRKGDRVAIYMPMVLELVVAMLACARIGAVHSIVFGGFSAETLTDRLNDSRAKVLVTADGVWRGDKLIELKKISDAAIEKCDKLGHRVSKQIVLSHLQRVTVPGKSEKKLIHIPWDYKRDLWWHDEMKDMEPACYPEWMGAEEPLFILYTSGSTGKPKGVLHTTAGYLLHAATSFKLVFDYKPGDTFWCTADIGWITGHSYVVYGPLANGATSVMFEGTPFYPHNGRYWEVCDKYKVNQLYTAPTAIRSLMRFGDEPVKPYSLDSLKVLGTVGEPINPEAWLWYYKKIGKERCSIVDTYWQTETGGHVLTPLPGVTPMKPGSATFPFFGVQPVLLDEGGKEINGEGEGALAFSKPWPGIMRTVYNDHQRFESTYFSRFPGYYFTGDGARRDQDGYLWITGRVDDMLNVSGHLMSTAEVESVLTEHEHVAEAAVVARPHAIKGESLYCFITPKTGFIFNEHLRKQLVQILRKRIGPIAHPDGMQYAPGLPKTRSGKIVRRILRMIAINNKDIGDISTLADESIVDELFQHREENLKSKL